jgi:hypothetical protein
MPALTMQEPTHVALPLPLEWIQQLLILTKNPADIAPLYLKDESVGDLLFLESISSRASLFCRGLDQY